MTERKKKAIVVIVDPNTLYNQEEKENMVDDTYCLCRKLYHLKNLLEVDTAILISATNMSINETYDPLKTFNISALCDSWTTFLKAAREGNKNNKTEILVDRFFFKEGYISCSTKEEEGNYISTHNDRRGIERITEYIDEKASEFDITKIFTIDDRMKDIQSAVSDFEFGSIPVISINLGVSNITNCYYHMGTFQTVYNIDSSKLGIEGINECLTSYRQAKNWIDRQMIDFKRF